MRDPMSWALPLYRAWGIQVKVHLLFFIVTLPLFLRLVSLNKDIYWLDLFLLSVGFVFLIILMHEYGHSFAARAVGGSSDQIMLWPLGGLAYCEVPHTPRANFWVAIWGPIVNLIICAACATVMLLASYSPMTAFNPFANPIVNPTYSYSDGRFHTSEYGYRYYRGTTADEVAPSQLKTVETGYEIVETGQTVQRALLPVWITWLWRICWLSWWLFLFNMLIPAYPMDAGRVLHAFLWARTDYRSATVRCCHVGYVCAIIMFMASIYTEEVLLMSLCFFIAFYCYKTLLMETEGGDMNGMGYDFSQGYTSLERDEPKPQVKRAGFIKRWLQARQLRKLQAEHEQRAADETRMDDLLDKIAKMGKQSLTDEEKRFMERVSARYRNR